MSRVSSRTLRHYDHVGPLPPARTGSGGLRYWAAGWDEATAGRIKAEGDTVHKDLAAAMAAGAAVQDDGVQAIVGRHHAWVSHFWTPGREAYTGLGQLYVDDERFTATIDATAPGLAVFLRDAIAVYAAAHLD